MNDASYPTTKELNKQAQNLADKMCEAEAKIRFQNQVDAGDSTPDADASDAHIVEMYDDIPNVFKVTAGAYPGRIKDAIEMIEGVRDRMLDGEQSAVASVAAAIDTRLADWEGRGVDALRENYITKLAPLAMNQCQILDALIVNLDAYYQLLCNTRTEIHDISAATWWKVHTVQYDGREDDNPKVGPEVALLGIVAGALLSVATAGTATAVGVSIASAGISSFVTLTTSSKTEAIKDAPEKTEVKISGSTIIEVAASFRDKMSVLEQKRKDQERDIVSKLEELSWAINDAPNLVYKAKAPKIIAFAEDGGDLTSDKGFGDHK